MKTIQMRSDINYHNERFLMFVLDQMAYEYEKQGKDVIRMTLGKSELPLHDEIVSAITQAAGDFTKYTKVFPGGLPELKEALSVHYKNKYAVDIPCKQFIIGVGTSSLFRNLFYLLLQKGDEVLIPRPYYSLYHFCALLCGANVKYYDVNAGEGSLNLESFKSNFTDRTRVVVINNPGNPLGNILTENELMKIDEIVDGNAVIVNDEIYANICFDEKCLSVLQLKNTKSPFIMTNAFSKGYRMYSKRVGYCVVPDVLIAPMTVLQHHTLLTLDPIMQYGAIEALNHPEEVEYLVQLYRSRRDYTVQKLSNIDGIKPLISNGGFYITIDCKEYMQKNGIETSLDLARRIMEQEYVATVPGSDFGLPQTLRLSFSSMKYCEGIDRLDRFFCG